jgi:SAM-dependent methyltransferase
MVEATRRRARNAGFDNLDTLEMDAADLRFREHSFDAVTGACGLMFCPEPEKVVSEMRRVLVSRGRVAIAVWDEPSRNPFFTIAGGAISSVLPTPVAGPTASAPFRFGVPGELEAVLCAGGLVEVTVERVAMTFELESTDDYWRIFTGFAAGVAARIAVLSEEDRRRAREALRSEAKAFMADGRLRLAATALCASARTPRSTRFE